MAYDSEFIPAGLDKHLRQWALSGITACCTVAHKDGLQSLIHISESYRGREDRLRCFQVTDHFNKDIKQTDNRASSLISIFTDAQKDKDTKHFISKMYKLLQSSRNLLLSRFSRTGRGVWPGDI